MAAPTKTKTGVLLVTLLGLTAAMAYMFSPSGDAEWGEPTEQGDAADDATAPRGDSIGPADWTPEDEADEPAFRARAAFPGDAGAPPVDPTLLPGSELAERTEESGETEAPEEEETPREPAPLPVQIEEMTPEREHRRAVFFRDLVAQRIADTRAAAEAARREGRPNRAARLERMAEQMAESLPRAEAVEREHAARVEEAAAEETEGAEETGSEEDPGSEEPAWWGTADHPVEQR